MTSLRVFTATDVKMEHTLKKIEAVKKFMVMQSWPEGDEIFVPSVKTNILERKSQYLLVEMKRQLFNRSRGFQSCGFSHLMKKNIIII